MRWQRHDPFRGAPSRTGRLEFTASEGHRTGIVLLYLINTLIFTDGAKERRLVRCKICYDDADLRIRKMSGPPIVETIIVGVTADGETFRPSDWAERLCGCMSLFGEDQRISYSPYLKPIIMSGLKCVVVDRRLEQMTFCSDNELQVREGRHEIRQSLHIRNGIRVA